MVWLLDFVARDALYAGIFPTQDHHKRVKFPRQCFYGIFSQLHAFEPSRNRQNLPQPHDCIRRFLVAELRLSVAADSRGARVLRARCYISGVARRNALKTAILLAVGVIASISGCGYQLLGSGRAGELTVSVVTLTNDSVEPGVELVLTRALRQAFLRRAAPRLVSDPSRADLVIRGRVLPLDVRAGSYDTVALALEYRVEVTLALDVQDATGMRIRIDPAALKEAEVYLASADAEAARKNRDEALRRIADVLAGRIQEVIGLQLSGFQRSGGES